MEIYNLHCSALLFEGDLMLQLSPQTKFSPQAEKLNYLCQKYLPECEGLLEKHPEMMLAYERIIQKYQRVGHSPIEAETNERCLHAKTKPLRELVGSESSTLQYGS